MDHSDYRRLDWIDEAINEVEVRIRRLQDGSVEVFIGRVDVQGPTLRDALDKAMDSSRADRWLESW